MDKQTGPENNFSKMNNKDFSSSNNIYQTNPNDNPNNKIDVSCFNDVNNTVNIQKMVSEAYLTQVFSGLQNHFLQMIMAARNSGNPVNNLMNNSINMSYLNDFASKIHSQNGINNGSFIGKNPLESIQNPINMNDYFINNI